MLMLTSLSVDEISQPRFVMCSTDFRDLSFNVEMAPSCLKHKNCLIWDHVEAKAFRCQFPIMLQTACAGVFTRNARSSAKSASAIVQAKYRLLLAILRYIHKHKTCFAKNKKRIKNKDKVLLNSFFFFLLNFFFMDLPFYIISLTWIHFFYKHWRKFYFAVSSTSCTSDEDDLWDGRLEVIQLLFLGLLFPGFVQNRTQYPCAVPIYLFL